MTDAQLAEAGGPILHIPTVLGAVVPVYRLEGVTEPLRFPGPVLADIVLGKIRKWNDPALAAANPGVALPDAEITFVHRADGSGTSYILCDFLAKVSPEFAEKVGVATSVAWPIGVGAKGNEVAGPDSKRAAMEMPRHQTHFARAMPRARRVLASWKEDAAAAAPPPCPQTGFHRTGVRSPPLSSFT
jgi:hypothetical protein